MKSHYSIGLDYGTNSVRSLIVDVLNGREVGTSVWNYEQGAQGVVLARDPNLARHHPLDYVKGAELSIRRALAQAKRTVRGFKAEQVIGLGVDTTGSTPLPVDRHGQPLALQKRFAKEPAAMAWLWKDHTGVAEANQITELASQMRPQYLAKCGGTYSSEWFFSKFLRCLRVSPKVFDAAYLWVEVADWIPAMLTGTEAPEQLVVGVCAAGHKAMYNEQWGGYPDAEFLAQLDPNLGELRSRLRPKAQTIDRPAGRLTEAWAARTGLPAGIPVAVGAFDAWRGRFWNRTRRHGEDHRDQHVRHDGGAKQPESARHSGTLRHRRWQRVARLLRAGSRTVGRRRYLQLVCQRHSTGWQSRHP